jgi:hypothetical protein
MSNKKFEETVKDILETHKNIFESLAPYDTLEYEIGEWLVHNKDSLIEKLELLKKDKVDMFPQSLYDVYLHQYEEAAINLIRSEVTQALNLDPESSFRVNKNSISLTSKELLNPIKKEKSND